METKNILISIFSLFSVYITANAQFNTIGNVRYERITKRKSPQEATSVTPMDSITIVDSLSDVSGNNILESNGHSEIFSSDCILPYLHASLPLKQIRITSVFGMRHHPILHKYCMHNGIDLKSHYENVFSMLPGRVEGVGYDRRSGKYVIVQTAGYSISYCHLSSSMVSKGQYVSAGDVIGVSGDTGMSTGPHLHLTTKKDGKVFDPTILINYVRNVLDI